MTDYLERILKARVYDVAIETPLDEAPRLSRQLGCRVLLKREDLQPVFSFKLRGAYNRIAQLSAEEIRAGVIAASAGNHAQGVALAAQRLGAEAVIVMPTSTPEIKVEAVQTLGATVVLEGEDFDAAQEHALAYAKKRGLVFIHPFDDPEVIAGQGTIGLEIMRQCREGVGSVVIPIGGGGLIAGIASYIKALYPEIRIVGVEPEDAAAMKESLAAGHPVTLDRVGGFADGVAVRRVGDETFRICQQLVDEIVTVTTDETCTAIRDVFEDTRSIAEPAGALAVAGLKKLMAQPGAPDNELIHIAVIGGANMNFERLRHVAERANIGARREALLAVEIPEQRGSFKRFCEVLGERQVTEFNYRYADVRRAHIFVGVALEAPGDDTALIEALVSHGYSVVNLTDNELAKLHVRYMVGGYGHGVDNELVYRFRFPERRGALLDFLTAVGTRFNISLFHYRNHGSDWGRVLAGVQVPPDERDDFAEHLGDLGYAWDDETSNVAFNLFLA